ncbi:MAG: hypothetical protein DDT26_00036 [Dehalococcoidia bacterium]|nr:hypothetical protein [Chloroflexota bacterium]
MTTERVNIQVRENGSRVVARSLRDVGESADRSASALDQLNNALAAVGAGVAVATLARYADQYTNLQNRLRLVTDGTENLARVTKELQTISNDTRSDFIATGELYARLASSTKELGLGQRDLLQFTKSLNQAIVLSGASAEEAAGGIRQLSQGLASGALRGDELNSVLENFPRAADVIAQGLGVTRGELRKLGEQGRITAQQIVQAFLDAGVTLETEFATTVPTLSQSFTVLRNSFVTFVGELNETYGVTAALANLIIVFSRNLNIIIPIVTAMGIAFAAAFVPGLIVAFTAKLQLLFFTIAANPIGALAAVIGTAVVALLLLRDQIRLGVDETTTLGDLLRSIWEPLASIIGSVSTTIGDFFSWISGKSADAYEAMSGHVEIYHRSNESWWLKGLRVVLQVFDMIGGTIRATFAGLYAVMSQFVNAFIGSFKLVGDTISAVASGDIDAIRAAVRNNIDGYKLAASSAGTAFSDAFQATVISQSDSGLEAWLNGRIARAQEIGRERMAGVTGGGLTGGSGTTSPTSPSASGAGGGANVAQELERLSGALRSVLDYASPVDAAKRQLAEAEAILGEAVRAGLIPHKEAIKVYEQISDLMRDQIDPFGALNDEIDRNIGFLQMSNREREIETQLYRNLEDFKRSGVVLTREETDALRAKLVVEQELNRISQIRDSIESQSSGQRSSDTADLIAALSQARGDPNSGVSAGDAFGALNNAAGGLLGGSQEAIRSQLEQQQFYFAQVQMMRDADLISEQTYAEARMAVWANTQSIQLQQAEGFFGSLAVLSKSENRKIAAIGKTAAIAQTLIHTYQSATAAYASMAAIPVVGPALGAAAAAAAIIAGMANVQAIRSQTPGFRTGGNMVVGGRGGTDSQLVSFRATPGERVQVNTPAQARALERSAEERDEKPRNFVQNLTIVQQGRPDRSTTYQTARLTRRETFKEFTRS